MTCRIAWTRYHLVDGQSIDMKGIFDKVPPGRRACRIALTNSKTKENVDVEDHPSASVDNIYPLSYGTVGVTYGYHSLASRRAATILEARGPGSGSQHQKSVRGYNPNFFLEKHTCDFVRFRAISCIISHLLHKSR